MDTIKNFFTSRSYKWVLWFFAEILILTIVFALGVRVGLHKAKYSFQWGANYERNFMGHPSGPMKPGMMPIGPGGPMDFLRERGGDFRNAHGLSGEIISIADNKIVIKGNDGKENTVAVGDKTIIKAGPEDIKIDNLKSGERVVIIGKPDSSGVINADLIRVFFNNNPNSQSQN